MRTHYWIPALALSAALSLAACGDAGAGEDNEGTEAGGVQVQDGGVAGSDNDGRSVSGSESAQEQATSVNDTTPHRPGVPSTP